MSLGVGEGGEQNAPLARAVIGGLLFATLATLIFVPAMYRLLRARSGITRERTDEGQLLFAGATRAGPGERGVRPHEGEAAGHERIAGEAHGRKEPP